VELGFENTLTQTWIVDLRGGRDAVWGGLRDRARGEIRKAERAGVTVRKADAPGDVDRYHSLHVETYRRTGATPHPLAYFERIWSNLVSAGRAVVFFAELDGEVVAARNFGTFKQAGLYWTGAASDRGLEVGAGALLQWHAMEWMLEHGFEWSETGEAFPGTLDSKLRGLSLHKAGFGGELYPLYRGRQTLKRRSYDAVDALGRLRAALRL
jgi:lipid II:glycine glycyltransferase (peptidoglycan interpeptide bridge formation enzyme)